MGVYLFYLGKIRNAQNIFTTAGCRIVGFDFGCVTFIYTQPPQAICLVPIQPIAHHATIDSSLIWFKKSDEEKFLGLSIKKHPELNQQSRIYVVLDYRPSNFYNTQNYYLFPANSGFSKFIQANANEIAANKTTVFYSKLNTKFQVEELSDEAFELKKSEHSALVFSGLSESAYQDLMQRAAQDPKLKAIITNSDPLTRSVTIDPTHVRPTFTEWLHNAWSYLQSSFKMDSIIKSV